MQKSEIQSPKKLINSNSYLSLALLKTQETIVKKTISKRLIIDKKIKQALLEKIYSQSKKIKQAALELGINYSSAKTMMFYHRKKMAQVNIEKREAGFMPIEAGSRKVDIVNNNFLKSNKYFFEIEEEIQQIKNLDVLQSGVEKIENCEVQTPTFVKNLGIFKKNIIIQANLN